MERRQHESFVGLPEYRSLTIIEVLQNVTIFQLSISRAVSACLPFCFFPSLFPPDLSLDWHFRTSLLAGVAAAHSRQCSALVSALLAVGHKLSYLSTLCPKP